ncbi:MAG TPA: MFS transporter [Bacteriovoracaceae bacterium]|nr:MFS transporter [Bacteriovoracaceae bacterium]
MNKTPLVSTKQHVRSSFRDAVYTSLNIGMAESYFCAFMLALGISELTAGFGTVLAQFIGVCFQLLSIRTFFRKHPLKKRLLLFLALQALAMIPLMLVGQYKLNSSYLIIGILGMYWASLLSLNPPWNRLMGNTVPARFRLRFFSIRNQFGQIAVLTGLVISGCTLYWAKNQSRELEVFVWIFTLGFLLKSFSWFELKYRHNSHQLPKGIETRLKMREFVKRLRHTEQGKLVTFLIFFYTAAHFSGPYHVPYMLNHLKFNYLEYMAVTATSYFGRVFMFRILQKRARSRHINTLLIISCVGIASSPLLWALSKNYSWILGVEFLSGCYWAGFELATVLLYYQKIEDHERTSIMSYITFFNITGMVIGSLLGALFMRHLPPSLNPYIVLFATSTFLRVLVIIFAPHVNFRGNIPKLISFNRVFMVLPPFGALTRPVVGKIKKKGEEKEIKEEKEQK